MIDVAELRRLYRVKRVDFAIALAALVAVLSVGILAGVVIGVGLSLAWLVVVTTAPEIETLREDGVPGVVVVRPDGGLFFATADALHDRLRELAEAADPPLHAVVLDLEGVNFVDSQGAAKLTELRLLGESHHIALRLARVKRPVRSVLEAEGVRLPIHGSVHEAVEAEERELSPAL
jgi:anti-anti-sigma factor